MLFCGAGYNVHLFDVKQELVTKAIEDIGHQLQALEASKMLRGNLSVAQQLKLVTGIHLYIIINKSEIYMYNAPILSQDRKP